MEIQMVQISCVWYNGKLFLRKKYKKNKKMIAVEVNIFMIYALKDMEIIWKHSHQRILNEHVEKHSFDITYVCFL